MAKFFAKISPSIPIIANPKADIPTTFERTISKYSPPNNPKINPIFFLANNPINRIRMTYILGIIPAIVNPVKKFS